MMSFLFGGPSEDDLKSINKGLKKENADLVKANKKLVEQHEADTEAQRDYEKKQNKRSDTYFREQDEKNRLAERTRDRELDEAIEDAERKADKRIREIEVAADKRVRDAEAKVGNTEVAVKKAVLDVREENIEATSELEVEVAAESARADGAEKLVKFLMENATDSQKLVKDFIANGNTVTKSLIEKLPEVDLTKLSVNVEMPAPEVTVISNGQKQGGDNKNGK